MTNHSTGWWVGYGFGAVAGSLAVGVILGLIPLILGQSLGNSKLGRVGFLCTVVAAFFGGVFLAAPATLGFVSTIALRWRRTRRESRTEASLDG